MTHHFLTLEDHSAQEIHTLLELARMIKLNPKAFSQACRGKTLAMIFQKPSLRTRVSFQTGIFQLGGQGIYLGPTDIQLHRGESISDTAKVLSRYVDGIMARVFSHDDVVGLAAHSAIPIINGLSDLLHPCQVLADLLTIQEHFRCLSGLKLAYVGDGNNMAHSLMLGCAKVGLSIAVAHPKGYAPNPSIINSTRSIAAETGAAVQITEDPYTAVQNAHILYADVWASMGQEEEAEERKAIFAPYQINDELIAEANPKAIFLHCLPAHRGEEVTATVIDGPQSKVFAQAENRLHAQKALLVQRL